MSDPRVAGSAFPRLCNCWPPPCFPGPFALLCLFTSKSPFSRWHLNFCGIEDLISVCRRPRIWGLEQSGTCDLGPKDSSCVCRAIYNTSFAWIYRSGRDPELRAWLRRLRWQLLSHPVQRSRRRWEDQLTTADAVCSNFLLH